MPKNSSGKKVSIILIHYNQMEYIYIAIDSILNQTYKNIEFIIADDASTEIDTKQIDNYIKEHNKNNFDYKLIVNKKNMGTVKNINNALQYCKGDYLLVFAADDCLYDNRVIENYIKSYQKQKKDVSIIFSQCYMMDEKLEKEQSKFIFLEEAEKFNKLSSKDQFYILVDKCFAAMGACMLNLKVLKENNGFNERFKYIEDWSYFLQTTRNGYRMIYVDFNGLLHRDGGISHTTNMTQLKIDFYKDLILLTEIYKFPSLNELSDSVKKQIIDNYIEQKAIVEDFNQKNAIENLKIIPKQHNYRNKLRTVRNHLLINSVFLILLIELNQFLNYRYNKIFETIIITILFLLIIYIIITIINIIIKIIKNRIK